MKKQIMCLYSRFCEIRKMGWVKSSQRGYGGVGITFERLLGKESDEFFIPDYNGIEIKTKMYYTHAYVTLFCLTPWGKYFHEVARLKDNYGYPDTDFPQFKVLRCKVSSNIFSKVGNYYFSLRVDYNRNKIFLCVYDSKKNLVEDFVYWDFDDLKTRLLCKMKVLAYVKAYRKKSNGFEYFKYDDIKFYSLKSFETFLSLIEKGIIRIQFNLSIRKSKDKLGKIYDHGTSFIIKEFDLLDLYDFVK